VTVGWTGHCGNAAIATRLYFSECEAFFLKKTWHFNDIFRQFLKISILFEDIFREIEAFLIILKVFQRLHF
jgi:hypothetical protein